MNRLIASDPSLLLSGNAFWACHLTEVYLFLHPDGFDGTQYLESFFGQTLEESNALGESIVMSEPERWPTFTITLFDEFKVIVRYEFDRISGTLFEFARGDGPASILGHQSGHFMLPAFRWDEIAVFARNCDQPDAALLLLLPAVYLDANEVAPASQALMGVFQRMDVPRALIPQFTHHVATRLCGDTSWRYDSELGWISSSLHCIRNPERVNLTRQVLLDIKALTDALGLIPK